MGCLKLQPGTLKQCLEKEDGHKGDCIFTLLKPEVAAAEDKRKARDHQLVRRQVALGLIPTIMTIQGHDTSHDEDVDLALVIADDLIAKTGGHSP